MLTQPLIQQLHELRLRGMAASLEQQNTNAERAALSFEERLGLMMSLNVPPPGLRSGCVGRGCRKAR